MKYALISCVALVACVAMAWALIGLFLQRTGRRGRLVPRLAASACLGLLLLAAGAGLWLSRYYHADEQALQALEGGPDVAVAKTDDGILFDGPKTRSLLVFLPGAKVQSEAYAPLLLSVATNSADCLLVDPPAHLALLSLSSVERLVETSPYEQVVVAGHSLGGLVASSCAARKPDLVDGVVLLASYPTSQLPEGLSLLSVFGTNDKVLDNEAYQSATALRPARSRELEIEGANHAGFGCYGPQQGDGVATIPAAEQQAITARSIGELIDELEGERAL